MQLEASITTDFLSLMALGTPVVGKYEDPALPPQLVEKPKLLATPQYSNGTVVRSCSHGSALLCKWLLSSHSACGYLAGSFEVTYVAMLRTKAGDML